jgi:hypothetical protein
MDDTGGCSAANKSLGNYSDHKHQVCMQRNLSFVHLQVSTAAFHAQPARPYKSHYNTESSPPMTITLGQYTCFPPRDARNTTGKKEKKIYDRHIFPPSSNMQKTHPG